MNFSITQFMPEDFPVFKALRLEALELEVAVFGSNFIKEAAYTDEDWKRRLSDVDAAFFGLFEGREAIGITGIAKLTRGEPTALMISSYIRSAYRKKRLSSLFFKARIRWAKKNGIKKVVVSHRKGNLASQRAILSNGFEFTHDELITWPDGVTEGNLYYALII